MSRLSSPSNSLTATDLSVFLGPQQVLAQVGVRVTAGDRVAVLGPNGVGKTTLLRLLAGELRPDTGTVVRSPASATVGLLPQERDARPGETVTGYLSRRTGAAEAEAELETATTALAAGTDGSEDRYAVALERYLGLGAADLESRAPGVLAEVGLDPTRLSDLVGGLSGGQLARLALASVLLARFDILLLDEPTNDLDIEGLAQLESFLRSRAGALLVVSHDRAFLERIATDVLEIDEFSRKSTLYGGGFASYREERERARAAQQEAYQKYVEQKNALTERARRQREWARRGAAKEKRNPSDNDKMLRDAKIERTQNRAAKAAVTERALERLEQVEEPRTPWDLRLSLDAASRSGNRVAGLEQVLVRRGSFVLGPVRLELRYGDRLVVVGPNGSGKTTLIDVLLGRLTPDEGERWLGRGVTIGQVDQVRRGVSDRATLLEAFRHASGVRDESTVRSLLAKFGLEADDVLRSTGSLSPGERTRADLALLMARQANMLVLDEPTNHLDLPAVEQLEQALASYDGTLVLASHDRRLLDAVHATHRADVRDGTVEVTAL